jgi:hypothetical protein
MEGLGAGRYEWLDGALRRRLLGWPGLTGVCRGGIGMERRDEDGGLNGYAMGFWGCVVRFCVAWWWWLVGWYLFEYIFSKT